MLIMKLVLMNVGKTDESYLQQGILEYTHRISRFAELSLMDLPALKARRKEPPAELCRREGELILKTAQPFKPKVLLDEKGRQYSSREYAAWLQKIMSQGWKEMVFITGGAYGFSEEVYREADYSISLSRMTFTHQMVRLVFLEQLYRAFTILKGMPYHND